jgi:hypothetical protein
MGGWVGCAPGSLEWRNRRCVTGLHCAQIAIFAFSANGGPLAARVDVSAFLKHPLSLLVRSKHVGQVSAEG